MPDFIFREYIALTIGLYIGNTPALIAAMYFALTDRLSLVVLVVSALLSTLIWDLTWYGMGRGLAHGKLKKIIRMHTIQRGLAIVDKLYKKHPLKIIFFARFAYGFSSAAAVGAGWNKIRIIPFMFTTIASMTCWFFLFYGISALIHTGIASTEAAIQGVSIIFPIFFVVMAGIYYIGRRLTKKYLPENFQDAQSHDFKVRKSRTPKISVIIPAAFDEQIIAKALASVHEQAYENYECIVVLNGATTETETIARKNLREGDQCISFPEATGPSKARNSGAEKATGDILVFLDADSYMGQGVLAKISEAWQKGGDLGTTAGGPDSDKKIHWLMFWFRNMFHKVGIYKGVMGGIFFCDREVFREVKGYDKSLKIDEHYDLISRMRDSLADYIYISNVRSFTSMRRHDKVGIIHVILFWTHVLLHRLGVRKQIPRKGIY